MSKININYQNGGIGGTVASTDFISAFIFDSTVLPSGFATGTTVLPIYSVKDAENLGITNTSIGETKATGGKVTIVSGQTTDEVININITPLNGSIISIGNYTVKNSDTASIIATGLANSITLGANGYSATSSGATISIVAPDGLGASINGAGIITVSSTGSISSTITNFSGGVGSQIDNMHYIISSYFNTNSVSKLWIKISDFTSAFDANDIKVIQTASGGEIRQLGIWTKKGLDGIATIVSACQNACVDQATKKKPLSVLIGAQKGTATLSTLVNLRTLTSPRVSVTISNPYGTNALGYRLKGITGNYPTDLGECLGHISRSSVGNSIAWVQNNLTQNADTMLVTGEKWIDIEDTTIASELDAKGYIYEGKYFGYSGSYFQNDAVADTLLSDYDSIKRVRTMDKVARISNFVLTPYLSSPLIINATDGTISQVTINKFISVLNQGINPMYTATEISGYQVNINASQNVLINKELVVSITIVPIGSADTITVNLGYALQLQ